MRHIHRLPRLLALVFRFSVMALILSGVVHGQVPAVRPVACPNLQATDPELSRIAAVLKVCTQAANVIDAKTSPILRAFRLQLDTGQAALMAGQPEQSHVQTEQLQESTKSQLQEQLAVLQNNSEVAAVNFAATRATLEINRMLLVMERNRSKSLVAQMTAEQKAYRRTKILNAFLGTSIGVVGSGMQFSNSTAVQHEGDGVSVAGGAASILFAVCTADVNVVDSEPTYAASQGAVHDYLQMTNPELLAPADGPKPAQQRGPLSCHSGGAPHQQTLTVAAQQEREDKLTGALLNMNNKIGALLARLQ
jgi:hypothetical protein